MKHYEPKTFTIPVLKGISAKSIEEHLKLYEGYVKHVNLIHDHFAELSENETTQEKYTYELSELGRRFSFEYNGMKNHEHYFAQLEGGPIAPNPDAALMNKISEEFGSWETFIKKITDLCLTRGIGWAVLWYDKHHDQLITSWVDEQHLGQLNSAEFILGIDMWEHSYVADYHPSGKKQYILDYLSNVNWSVVEKRFEN